VQYPFFIGPAYTSQSVNLDGEDCVNLYVEQSESPGAKAQFALYPTPGFELIGSFPTAPIKQLYEVNGRNFVVSGNTFYEVLSLSPFTFIARGVMATDTNPATMCSNGEAGNQVFITSGGQGYCFDLGTNAFANVISGVIQGGFLDGYFLALNKTTSQLFVSDLEDGMTWDPLQFTQRNTAADNWIGFTVTHREVWLHGSRTSEVWYDAGSFPFPLQPIPGAFIEQGTVSSFSTCTVDSTDIWLGQSKDGKTVVWRNSGYTPQRISTHAVEYAFSKYADVSDAIAWTYQDQGHYFYVLTFPTANATWVFDTGTSLWHRRGFWDGTTTDFQAQRNAFHAMMSGKHVTGDRVLGTLYEQTINSSQDADGRLLRRLRRATHLSNEQQRMYYFQAQLDMEVGLGTAYNSGSDPQIMLRTSDDGGHVYSTERWASGGKMGQFKQRVLWRRLGRSRDRVFEVSFTEPIPWRLINFYLQIEPGTS